MAHHPSLRQKAVELRATEGLTIDQIADRLALSRTTVYSWVRGMPIPRTPGQSDAQRRAARANSRRAAAQRRRAYDQGAAEFVDLAQDPTFCDFVCMYIGEGSKRSRNTVAIANSDPKVIVLGNRWITRFSRNPVTYWVQYHADQSLTELRTFWADLLDTTPDAIKLQRKSNSNNLSVRKWRSRYGVLTVCANDTMLRSRLQAWIDLVQKTWV